MNKKSVIIDFLFVFFLTLIILVSSFSTSFILSNSEAKTSLKTYADNVNLAIDNGESYEDITKIYSSIIDLRVTIFDNEAEVLLEINNDDLIAAKEDRLVELENNSNNYYYKDSRFLNFRI